MRHTSIECSEGGNTIELEKDAYEDFDMIRTFPNNNNLTLKDGIIYTFASGPLGWRVMKGYYFF